MLCAYHPIVIDVGNLIKNVPPMCRRQGRKQLLCVSCRVKVRVGDIGRIRVKLMVGVIMADDSIKSQRHTKQGEKKGDVIEAGYQI